MMKIALLHTAESNISVFQKAASEIGLPQGALHHVVRADLLAAAEKAGGLTQEIARETGAALLELARNADAVVLACSTLGPAIAEVENAIEVPVLRVDGALAKKAVKSGGLVVAICAVETTSHRQHGCLRQPHKQPARRSKSALSRAHGNCSRPATAPAIWPQLQEPLKPPMTMAPPSLLSLRRPWSAQRIW